MLEVAANRWSSRRFRRLRSSARRHVRPGRRVLPLAPPIYVRHTGQDYATIEKTLDRDYFLSAEDARTFGIVDEVITKRDPLDEKIQKLMPVS